jgi:hypothetical protein
MEVHRVGGRNCIDATSTIEIEITEQDTRFANRKDPTNCVMARACMKQESTDAIVHISRIYLKVKDKDLWTRYGVDGSLRTEIIAFDRGGDFAPGIYMLHTLQPCKKLGADKRKRPNHPKNKVRKTPVVLRGVRTSANFGKQNTTKK